MVLGYMADHCPYNRSLVHGSSPCCPNPLKVFLAKLRKQFHLFLSTTLGGSTPYEYVDGADGIEENGIYTTFAKKISN
jgi:hypothetical protein